MRALRRDYEALWESQIDALIAAGQWRIADSPRLSRLAFMGALNWSVQWYRPERGDTIAGLTDTVCRSFLEETT